MALIVRPFTDNRGWNFFREWTNPVNGHSLLSRNLSFKIVGVPTSDATMMG